MVKTCLPVNDTTPFTVRPMHTTTADLWHTVAFPTKTPACIGALLLATLGTVYNHHNVDVAAPTTVLDPSVPMVGCTTCSEPKPVFSHVNAAAQLVCRLPAFLLLPLMVTKNKSRTCARLAASIHIRGSGRRLHYGGKTRPPTTGPIATLLASDQKKYWYYGVEADNLQSNWQDSLSHGSAGQFDI